MNVLAIHDIADNGARVQSCVTLLWDEDRPFAELPFRAQSSVDGVTLCTSHHTTAAKAKREAEKMHAAYLEVHSGAAVPA